MCRVKKLQLSTVKKAETIDRDRGIKIIILTIDRPNDPARFWPSLCMISAVVAVFGKPSFRVLSKISVLCLLCYTPSAAQF